jgi:hypothetical protein
MLPLPITAIFMVASNRCDPRLIPRATVGGRPPDEPREARSG